MITGSHNPSEFNGFKTVCGESTIHGETIQEIRRIIEARRFRRRRRQRAHPPTLVTPYVDEVSRQFHFTRRIKVVLDAGNGTAGPVMHRILAKPQLDATEMFFEMDGRFPNHHPDPTVPANLAALDRQSARKPAPSWASPSTATPTASARSTSTARWSTATS